MSLNFKQAFTLTEVLVAVVIAGIIAALVIPAIITKYQQKTLSYLYEREVQAISAAVEALTVTENKSNFFETSLYKDSAVTDYDDSTGKFMKKYLRVAKYCGSSNGNCFASKYFEYKNKDKVEYVPTYEGACASLKNGISICMKPQIGGANIEGLIDLNGKKGPNVLNIDLKKFSISSKTRTVLSKDTEPVLALENDPLNPVCNTCDCDPTLEGCTPPPPPPPVCTYPDPNDSSRCCESATITSSEDACCTINEIKNNNSSCSEEKSVTLTYTFYYLSNSPSFYSGSDDMTFSARLSSSLPQDVDVNAWQVAYGGSRTFSLGNCTIPAGSLSCRSPKGAGEYAYEKIYTTPGEGVFGTDGFSLNPTFNGMNIEGWDSECNCTKYLYNGVYYNIKLEMPSGFFQYG